MVSHGKAEGNGAMQSIQMLFRHGPLFDFVFVHDVAHVADEDNILIITMLENPVDLSFQIRIRDRILAARGGLAVPAEIRLRVRDNDKGECLFRHRRKRAGSCHSGRFFVGGGGAAEEHQKQHEGN